VTDVVKEEETQGGGALTGLGLTEQRVREWLIPELAKPAAKKRRKPSSWPRGRTAGGAGRRGRRARAASSPRRRD
jgi:hypothetical protein